MQGAGGVVAVALAIALAGCGGRRPPPPTPPPPALAPAPAPPAPPPHELTLPPLALTLVDGTTAQVFHVVDELSAWSPWAHPAYASWAKTEMELEDAERALLEKHARLRRKRRWGSLDQAFDVNAPLADAARVAADTRILTAEDAEDERALLAHFAPRLGPFLTSHRPEIAAFEARLALELPRLAPRVAELGRFCEVTEVVSVRAVLVATPAPEGEERVTRATIELEIAAGDDPFPAFVHGLARVIFLRRRATIAIAAGKCDESIDDETFEEGLALRVRARARRRGDRSREEADRGRPLRDPRARAASARCSRSARRSVPRSTRERRSGRSCRRRAMPGRRWSIREPRSRRGTERRSKERRRAARLTALAGRCLS